MTSSQMINNFRMTYDIVNLEGPGYEDDEILVFLNQAQVIEVMKEISLKRWTYISNLIENNTYNTSVPAWSPLTNHRYVTPLADDYIGYVSSKSLITRSTYKATAGAEWVDNKPIRKEQSGKYLTNNNNLPILINPVVYEEGDGNISIIHDRNTVFSGANDFLLEFISIPEKIEVAVDCALNEFLHERIVNTAVDLGKKVFNPQEAGISQQTDQLIDKPNI